jgi:hypothetical protein
MEAGLLVTIDGVQYTRHYNDSPGWPHPDCEREAEEAFRKSYLAAAREAAEWDFPDVDSVEAAHEAREEARRQAEVVVTSAKLFNDPSFDDYDPPGTHFLYRIGHEVEASRTRGRHQALDICKRDWWELTDLGLDDDEEIRRLFMRPWVEAIMAWVADDPDGLWAPPRPIERFTPAQWQAVLSQLHGQEHIFENLEDAVSHIQPEVGLLRSSWDCRDQADEVLGRVFR